MESRVVANIEVLRFEGFIDLPDVVSPYEFATFYRQAKLTLVRIVSSMGVLLNVLAILTRWHRGIEETTVRRI